MLLMEKKNEFTTKKLMRKPNIVEVGEFRCDDFECIFGDDGEEGCLDLRSKSSGLYNLSNDSKQMCEVNFMISMVRGDERQAENYYIALALSDDEYNETVRIFVDKNTDRYIYIFSDLADTYYTGNRIATCEDEECCDIGYDAENGMLLVKMKYLLSNCTEEYKNYLREILKNYDYIDAVQVFGTEATKVFIENQML